MDAGKAVPESKYSGRPFTVGERGPAGSTAISAKAQPGRIGVGIRRGYGDLAREIASSRWLPTGPGLLERGHEGPDAFQGGRGLPDRIDLGVEDGQVMNAGQEPLP